MAKKIFIHWKPERPQKVVLDSFADDNFPAPNPSACGIQYVGVTMARDGIIENLDDPGVCEECKRLAVADRLNPEIFITVHS